MTTVHSGCQQNERRKWREMGEREGREREKEGGSIHLNRLALKTRYFEETLSFK